MFEWNRAGGAVTQSVLYALDHFNYHTLNEYIVST